MHYAVAVIAMLILVGCTKTPAAPAGRTLPWLQQQTVTTAPDGTVTTQVIAATPAEQANADWVRYGAIMAIVGFLAMLPTFGGNIRTGAVIVAGAAAMAFIGNIAGDVKLEIPAWLTPVVVILLAAGMVWGYHVRASQQKEVAND